MVVSKRVRMLGAVGRVATAFRLKDGCEEDVRRGQPSGDVATAFRLKDGCEWYRY